MNDSIAVFKRISSCSWGDLYGDEIFLFTLRNSNGTIVKITNYGATITFWTTVDKSGKSSNIVLGFETLKEYLAPPPYFGSTIGRCANRIAKGKFTLNGKQYSLAINNGPHHLHGGLRGFDKVVWQPQSINEDAATLTLHYFTKDGEEGYPGNLNVSVAFTLSDEDEIKIIYDATTDMLTPVNLTNHSYFNLSGNIENTILDHSLLIHADKYTPVDDTLIPTGEMKDVEGTPFDFTQAKRIGQEIDRTEGGYDHNFILNKRSNALEPVALLTDDISGRQLQVFTTEPGIQFYSGNFLDGSLTTSKGVPIDKHTGLCLETQHFPNSPNEPSFPSVILQPGHYYHSETIYKVIH